MPPLRVLHISTRLILGGSQENTVLSCEGQAALGHDVHLAFGPIYGPEGSMLERVQSFRAPNDHAITTHVVPDMVRPLAPVRDPKAYLQLRRLVRALNPDVVHTHSSKAGVLGRAAAWAVKRPNGRRPAIVHTIHGPPFHPYQSAWRNRVYVSAERFAAKRCHHIAGVCDAMIQQFKSHRIGRDDLYSTVYSGMEAAPLLDAEPGATRHDVRAALEIPDDAIVLGTVARLAEHKGHDDVIDALTDDLRANAHWRLLWVGDGWWRGRLLARLRDAGAEDQVVTTGLVPPERIPGLIRAMDALIHPSYREGLPRAVVQAMLVGVPVVATNVDGTPEVCIPDRTGWLVPPASPDALRDAVRGVFSDPPRARDFVAAARAMCAERFSKETMVESLESVYARAIETADRA